MKEFQFKGGCIMRINTGNRNKCFTKKYKNRKNRSIAFRNAGRLKGGSVKNHNVSYWDTQRDIDARGKDL